MPGCAGAAPARAAARRRTFLHHNVLARPRLACRWPSCRLARRQVGHARVSTTRAAPACHGRGTPRAVHPRQQLHAEPAPGCVSGVEGAAPAGPPVRHAVCQVWLVCSGAHSVVRLHLPCLQRVPDAVSAGVVLKVCQHLGCSRCVCEGHSVLGRSGSACADWQGRLLWGCCARHCHACSQAKQPGPIDILQGKSWGPTAMPAEARAPAAPVSAAVSHSLSCVLPQLWHKAASGETLMDLRVRLLHRLSALAHCGMKGEARRARCQLQLTPLHCLQPRPRAEAVSRAGAGKRVRRQASCCAGSCWPAHACSRTCRRLSALPACTNGKLLAPCLHVTLRRPA